MSGPNETKKHRREHWRVLVARGAKPKPETESKVKPND